MRFGRIVPFVLAVVIAVGALPHAVASPDNPGADESAFVARIGQARAAQGLPGLPVAGDLATIARRNAQRMAREGRLSHDTALPSEVGGWSKVGENIGTGSSVDVVHSAFMGSSVHRGHILDPAFTDIGVGVAWSGGSLWVSEVFRQSTGPRPVPVVRVRAAPAPRASRAAPRARPAPPPPPPPPPPTTTTTTFPERVTGEVALASSVRGTARVASPHDGSGAPWPVVAMVAALAGAGVTRRLRRRRAASAARLP